MTDHTHTTLRAPIDDRIKMAALTLAIERGLTSVSMSDVAARAEVTRQTVYSRHKDIDSIIVSALSDHHTTSVAQLRSLLRTATTTVDRIELLVRQVVATAAHGSDLAQFYLGLSPDARSIIDEHDNDIREIITQIIADGIKSGDVASDLNPQATAVILHAMLTGGTNLAHDSQDTATATTATTTLIHNAIDART